MDWLQAIHFESILFVINMILRFMMPLLGLLIVWLLITSLLYRKDPARRPTAVLVNAVNRDSIAIDRPELSIGRSKSADVRLNYPTISRNHAVLLHRKKGWFVTDIQSQSGVLVNEARIKGRRLLQTGDTVTLGGIDFHFSERNIDPDLAPAKLLNRLWKAPSARPGRILFLIVMFQVFSMLRLGIAASSWKEPLPFEAFAWYGLFILLECSYCVISRRVFRREYPALELSAFFLCGIGMTVTASVLPGSMSTQMVGIVIGLAIFGALVWFMKDPDRVMKYKVIVGAAAVGLWGINLTLGQVIYGSKNWIKVGSVTLQPSELVKIAFVLTGAATLDRLLLSKHLTWFIAFFALSIGALVYMGDFGAAAIYFATFIIIAIMRSGDWRTIVLICAGAVVGVFLVLLIKPYVASRFAVWRHVWDFADATGYQQTRVLMYTASGGFFGVGVGNGYLKYVAASTTDLVFGLVSEEWGLLLALLTVALHTAFAFYACRFARTSKSTLYAITACAAAGMMLFQSCLNIFGSTDILPLTGVTLPFVSRGGSSMMASWGLLAFLKAADDRTYPSRSKKPEARIEGGWP